MAERNDRRVVICVIVTTSRVNRQFGMRKTLVSSLLLLAALAACSGDEEPSARSKMTQRERDSTIAESNLPGSAVVRKAISMSDAQKERAATMDSASQ